MINVRLRLAQFWYVDEWAMLSAGAEVNLVMENNMWIGILEKAFAKIRGTFHGICLTEPLLFRKNFRLEIGFPSASSFLQLQMVREMDGSV